MAGDADRRAVAEMDAAVRRADRMIAVLGATAYVSSQWPQAELAWGDTQTPPDPDDLDGVWCNPAGAPGPGQPEGRDLWIVVTATAGEYGPAERTGAWEQRFLAGTRDYLRFAASRLREHGQDRLAAAIEAEMYADRLCYLRLDTTFEGTDLSSVQTTARRYDISDAKLTGPMLDAAAEGDPSWAEDVREPLGSGAAATLAQAYWDAAGWAEKALLGHFLYGAREQGDPGLRRVFTDLLAIPDVVPGAEELADTARQARTEALTWLDGDGDRFSELYEDEDEQAARIAAHRAG